MDYILNVFGIVNGCLAIINLRLYWRYHRHLPQWASAMVLLIALCCIVNFLQLTVFYR